MKFLVYVDEPSSPSFYVPLDFKMWPVFYTSVDSVDPYFRTLSLNCVSTDFTR